MKIVFGDIAKETRFDEPVAAQTLDLGYSYQAQVDATVVGQEPANSVPFS